MKKIKNIKKMVKKHLSEDIKEQKEHISEDKSLKKKLGKSPCKK